MLAMKLRRLPLLSMLFVAGCFAQTAEQSHSVPVQRMPSGSVSATAEPDTTPVRPLRVGSSRPVAVPSFGYFGTGESDKNGNLYFLVGPSSDYKHAKVVKLSISSGDGQVYAVPEEAGSVSAFAVSPSGDVYVLTERVKPKSEVEYLVTSFDSKGHESGTTKLDIPRDILINDFLAFDDGAFFIGGYYIRSASESLRGKNFVAIFEKSGQLRKVLRGGWRDVDLNYLNDHPFDGASVISPENRIYVMRGQQVRVYSEDGEMQGRVEFSKPAPDFVAQKIAVTGRFLVVWLLRPREDGNGMETRYLVLDKVNNSEALALYLPEDDLPTVASGFTDTDGFLFLQATDESGSGLKLVTAPLK
jgi:hypothetical protein